MGKITINYDFFNEILNAREKWTGFKMIRAKKEKFSLLIPTYIMLFIISAQNVNPPILLMEMLWVILGMDYLPNKLEEKITGTDSYKLIAEDKLKELIPMLNDINVSTNYELLLDSKLDSKNYKIQKDDNNKKVLVQNKYIMVPTHNPIFNDEGQTQMTSIHQEHIVGTSDYVLSVGLNQKNKQKVLSPLFNPAKR